MENANTVICRVAFCPKCYAANRPKASQLFLVHGSFHDQENIRYALKHGVRGFTPHLYERLGNPINNTVVYRSLCTMHGCGVDIFVTTGNKFDWLFQDSEWVSGTLPLHQWNALVVFKNTGYEI